MFQLSGFYCKTPWPYNPHIVGFIQGTRIKAQGFLIRFLHYLDTPVLISFHIWFERLGFRGLRVYRVQRLRVKIEAAS